MTSEGLPDRKSVGIQQSNITCESNEYAEILNEDHHGGRRLEFTCREMTEWVWCE